MILTASFKVARNSAVQLKHISSCQPILAMIIKMKITNTEENTVFSMDLRLLSYVLVPLGSCLNSFSNVEVKERNSAVKRKTDLQKLLKIMYCEKLF